MAEKPAPRVSGPLANDMTPMSTGGTPITLNPEQREAVEYFEGPLLVLAGAGSGKTRVLTSRVVHLMSEHGVPPSRIMAVTFTNKAANEMRQRVSLMAGSPPAGIWLGTFHALGARLVRRHAAKVNRTSAFTILDAAQSSRQLTTAIKNSEANTGQIPVQRIRNIISAAKNELIGPEAFENYAESLFPKQRRIVAHVYTVYQQWLLEQNAVDFDDLLTFPVQLLEQNPEILDRYRRQFSFILVDEYQDTNRAQFRFVELLAGQHRNLMVVGDDDQSIYGWRGADIRNILDFETSFPGAKVVKLEQNYRSTPEILAAAHRVICQNVDRKPKTLRTDRAAGPPITCVEASDEGDEAAWIVAEIERRMLATPELDHRDFAMLYRTNAQSRALEDALRRRGMPYQIVGGVRFYERREIQDVLAYLRLLSNPRDRDAFHRAVSYPRRGVGPVAIERVWHLAAKADFDLVKAAAKARRIHGIRGRSLRELRQFADLIRAHAELAAEAPAGEVVRSLVEEAGIIQLLCGEGPEGEDRANNVAELIYAAEQFQNEFEDEDRVGLTDLDCFLQQVALVTDVDRHDPDADAVTLMTLHSSKGLEFPIVFIAGLEEGLFPLSRAADDPDLLEEERRLFYVGVTRAMDKLYLTHARRRRRAGNQMWSDLSSFAKLIRDRTENTTTRKVRGTSTRRLGREAGEHGGDGRFGYSFDQDRPGYWKGERVLHDTFGAGTIVETTGVGPDTKVVVDFPGVGRKKLLARYAGLRKDFP